MTKQLVTTQWVFLLQEVLRRSRPWYHREYYKHRVHPAIWDAFELARPKDWHQLVLEHPYKSDTDPGRIAYTQDDRAGEADRQTVTTIGKYLRRHFPDLSDHEIRDIQALHVANGIKIVRTTAEMIYHLQRGPRSCMVNSSFATHPYECYDPRYGWAMAVREDGNDTVGRALVNDSDPENKIFVRSYRKNNDGYSHSDEQLEAWLKSQGYTKANDWEGLKLKAIEHRNGDWVAPYLDGNVKQATLKSVSGERYFLIDSDGEYEMDNTAGVTREAHENTCEDCGDGYDDGDGYWVGIHEDRGVCETCINNYIYAYSRRGNQYHIPEDNVVAVQGDYYDTDYLDDNEIVCDRDGDYHRREDVIFIESDGEYYQSDDYRICYAEDSNEYELREDCWQCEESFNWYTNDCTDSVEIDGNIYHTDHAPEQTTKEETNE